MPDLPFWGAKSFGEWRRSDKTDEEMFQQILDSQKYQSWRGDGDATSAFITWAVALHLDNSQYWYDRVYDIIKSNGMDGKWGAVEQIKAFVEDPDGDLYMASGPYGRQSRDARNLLKGELESKAWGAINWAEVYDHFEVDWPEGESVGHDDE